MISPEEALTKILEHLGPLPAESVPLHHAVDRVLARDVVARDDLPPFDNSAMDGFALIAEDMAKGSLEKPIRLRIREIVRAGSVSMESLKTGEAMKIMTGAPLPKGTHAVVMKELTRSLDGDRVEILQIPEAGENIRRRGEDVRAGDLLIKKGTLLRPYEVALLASQGVVAIEAIRKPRVAIVATGDELVDAAEPLTPGKIRNSNGPALASALTRWGIPAADLGIVGDDPAKLEKKLRNALAQGDLILVSGGVSVGDFDYTRSLLQKVGMEEVFWKVAMKPGKPLLFGLCSSDDPSVGTQKPVFGLPGNPVSVLICLEEFVRPALEKMQGYSPRYPSYHLRGRVTNAYGKPEERQQYLFCRATADGEGYRLEIIRPQGSAMVGMACRANALAVSPIGVRRVNEGDVLPFRWLK